MDPTTQRFLSLLIFLAFNTVAIAAVGIGLFRAVRRRITEIDQRITAAHAEQQAKMDRQQEAMQRQAREQRALLEKQQTEQANVEARVRRLETAFLRQTDQLDELTRISRQLVDRAWMEDLIDRKVGARGGASQSLTFASGEHSAAVGGNVHRSPMITGDSNEIKQGE